MNNKPGFAQQVGEICFSIAEDPAVEIWIRLDAARILLSANNNLLSPQIIESVKEIFQVSQPSDSAYFLKNLGPVWFCSGFESVTKTRVDLLTLLLSKNKKPIMNFP